MREYLTLQASIYLAVQYGKSKLLGGCVTVNRGIKTDPLNSPMGAFYRQIECLQVLTCLDMTRISWARDSSRRDM